MARKMLTREVTKTTIKLARLEIKEGKPVAVELPDEIMLGNVNFDRATREMNKKFKGQQVNVVAVIPETKVYEMEVEKFIQLATEKVEEAKPETEAPKQA